MRKAGGLCDLSVSAINHYEQGRMNIAPERTEQLVKAYHYSMAEVREYQLGKSIPFLSLKDECISLLDLIDE